MKNSSIGIVSEIKAIAWLLEQDWEVFYNIKPHGPADIMVWNPETDEIKKIDVKTIRHYLKTDGQKTSMLSGLTPEKLASKNNGITYLGYDPDSDKFMWVENDTVH